MNPYGFSQQHNSATGILMDTAIEHDNEIYDDAMKDVDSIPYKSEDFSNVKAPKKSPNDQAKKNQE